MNNKYQNVACGGMDVHYRFSRATFRDARGKIVARERLDHMHEPSLRAQLSQWPKGVPIALEASFGWGWLSDVMLQAALEPHLSNCFKVEKMRKARGWAKSNRKDADLLSLLGLEPSRWWEVWLAPPEVRDRREWLRYRTDLVRMQTATKNRIHAIFHRHGIFHDFSDLFGSKGRLFLVALCRDGHQRLQPGALMALRGHVRLLDQIRKQLADVTRQLRRELERTELARRLDGIPGVGLILAHTLIAEIGDIRRFRNQRALASYCLLAPIAADSGPEDPTQKPLGRHLGVRGNVTLKWAFIEAARGAVRSGGRWRAMFDRYTQGGREHRNRGYIKVARALVKVVDAMWRHGSRYQATPPARPGSCGAAGQRRRRDARPGTGQSSLPMVAAR